MKKRLFIEILLVILLCMPNIVLANEEDNEKIEIQELWQEIEETSTDAVKEPIINSKAGVIFDRASKTCIYEKNSKEKRAMASTTKIMTAILVLEHGNLSDVLEVSAKSAGTRGSRLGLKKGDKITLNDLLYGLMLCSRK